MKPFKTSSKPILKNVIVSWYGEITLKILKKKTHKVHKNKSSFRYLNYVHMGRKKFKKQKTIHFKKTFENKVQF